MKRLALVIGVLSVVLCVGYGVFASAAGRATSNSRALIADFDREDLRNNLNGESGVWMLDADDKNQWAKAFIDSIVRIGDHGSSLRLEYCVNSPLDAITGFWTRLGGFDASGYDHLEFWVRGDEKKGFPKTFKVQLKKYEKRPGSTHEETLEASYIVKDVTGNWQKVSIPLNVMNGILDWRDLQEFVIAFEKRRVDRPEGVVYFDDIAFVKTGNPGPKITDIVRHRVKKSERPLAGEEFARFLIARLRGFPAKVFVKKEFPKDDREFLLEIARDTWGYFDNIVDKECALPIDNIEFNGETSVSKGTRIGDYTSITNVGLYLMCVVSAGDLGFITREEAASRLKKALDSIEKLEKFGNFPYNYYDITIFQRTSNFISFVDCGWLASGVVVAKNAYPAEIGGQCQKILDQMNFSFFYDPVDGHMYHGYYTNINYYSEYHYGAFYTETRAISYLAIGKGDVPREHWFMLSRTFPETWSWQTQIPKNRKNKTCLGYKMTGGYYVHGDMKYVPSWGGSMFEALMPTLIVNEKELAPKGLGMNDAAHARIQVKYALEELAYPVFGMSPSCIPEGGYTEYGARPLGIKGYREGVATPHASFLALEFEPVECVKNLRTMLEKYNIYGEYGFYDAVNVKTGKVAKKYLCLDQAMSFIALNNYLNNGAIRKRFHADATAKAAEELLSAEDFLE
jgi:hypothetical protein